MSARAAELLGGDVDHETGRVVIGRRTPGCRHCGAKAVHYAANGRAEIWHPGVTCCGDATRDQARYRTDDLNALRRQLQDLRDAIDAERRRADDAIGREAAAAAARVNAMTRGYEARLAITTPIAQDLKREIADLEATAAALDADAANAYPRPYREN